MSTDKTQLGEVVTEVVDGIGRITFSHPAHNSLPGRLLAQLANSITRMGEDPSVKVLILASGGNRTFCAGASFDELIAIRDETTGKKFFMGFANVINAMRKCPKFIIGRVQGKAIGGGVGLAAATDFCMATDHASIKLSELAIGIGPFVVGPAVARKLGTSAMSQLAINATQWQDAKWALQKGLYTQILDDINDLEESANNLACNLAGYNPEAMRLLKANLWKGTEDWDQLLEERAEISGRLILSDHSRQALAKFKSKA